MGLLISEEQVKAVSNHVDDAKVKGANVIAGERARPDFGPLFVEPTVLTGVPEDAECYRDETFGPLVSIDPVANVDETIARANDTVYGLNAQSAATTRIPKLDGPRGLPPKVWANVMSPFVKALQWIPGR